MAYGDTTIVIEDMDRFEKKLKKHKKKDKGELKFDQSEFRETL